MPRCVLYVSCLSLPVSTCTLVTDVNMRCCDRWCCCRQSAAEYAEWTQIYSYNRNNFTAQETVRCDAALVHFDNEVYVEIAVLCV